MNLLSRRLLVGAVVLWMTSAGAQTSYPGKAIRLIVPTPAGGPSDAAARALAKGMTAGLGQEVLVENRPGGNTGIGAGAVLN
ncbi:MAG: tripartite tricarboxylate transporter substrate binding protein, partial [Proteobacteria bacterium]|nr:tripartite tricarboxylate transporter substrate binding protein [Pseudomonadota bacterium]